MKVVAFNGSARKDGNTAILLNRVLNVLQAEGFETELVQLAGEQIRGCTACRTCFETKNQRCIIENDKVNEYIQKMAEADGVILGSPTYFSMMSPEMKALIDRAGFVARAQPGMFKHKVGARVARGEPLFTLHANDRAKFDAAKVRLLAAYTFSPHAPVPLKLIHKVIK